MLDGMLPEHGGEVGSGILKLWGTLWPVVGLVLLVGGVILILWTDVGWRRALQLGVGAFLGYLAFHSLTWVLSGNGPRTDAATYLGDRIQGIGIGLVALIFFVLIVVFSHISERRAQRVPDE